MHLRHHRIASRIYEQPWFIPAAKLREISLAFERHSAAASADDPVGPHDADGPLHPQIEVAGPVALARVHGVMGRRLSSLEMMCGGFDTALFIRQLANVAEDPAVRALVIDFDSPGGMASGTRAAAEAVLAVSAAGKKVLAYVSGDCCSAAYYVAAAADEIHADPDATVGSISTVIRGVDTSRQWAMEGRELKLFATGKFKATGMPGKAWTPEEEEMLWQRVRAVDAEFKGFVSSRRPGITADAMEGQSWDARFAPPGLVDSTTFPTLESFIQSVYAAL